MNASVCRSGQADGALDGPAVALAQRELARGVALGLRRGRATTGVHALVSSGVTRSSASAKRHCTSAAALPDDGVVRAGDEGEAERRARRLLHLGDDRAARPALHEHARVERSRELELRLRVRRVRDRHVALPGEIGLERHVLLADLRARRRRERAPVRVAVRLVERHAPVAVGVAGAAQGRHQVVREVRALQLVGLLAQLLRACSTP